MLFNSPVYIFMFLPIVLVVYFILNRYRLITAAKTWLVLASLFFYGYWDADYLLLIGLSIIVNFVTGREICASKQKGQTFTSRHISRKKLLVLGITFNLGLLGYFKYAHFLIDNINWISGADYQIAHIVLPLAISFFTFQQIAFLVDSYKKGLKEYDFLNYCLFVTFFPQLIIGPIVHHAEMMPQFKRLRNKVFNWNNLALGLFIFSMGLFKKVFIADSFAIWASAGFDGDTVLTFFEAWGSTLSFTFQIYYDFSGYTDMAIGAALMFNIHLPLNFNSPYKATNITDFWKRWHMTLMRWMRDYLYIPLRKMKSGELNAHFSLLMTFLISGLWHGASWMFVIFGLLHGIALSVHRLWKKTGYRMPALLGGFCTFFFVSFSLVFFRSSSFESVERLYSGMLGLNGLGVSADFAESINSYSFDFIPEITGSIHEMILPFTALQYLVVFSLLTFLHKNSIEVARSLEGLKVRHAAFIAFTLVFVILANIQNAPSQFIYFNF